MQNGSNRYQEKVAPQICGSTAISTKEVAEILNVGTRSVERAKTVDTSSAMANENDQSLINNNSIYKLPLSSTSLTEPARTVDVILSPKGDENSKSLISEGQIYKIPLSTTPLTEKAVRPIASSGLTDDQKREVWQQVFESGKPIAEKSVKGGLLR